MSVLTANGCAMHTAQCRQERGGRGVVGWGGGGTKLRQNVERCTRGGRRVGERWTSGGRGGPVGEQWVSDGRALDSRWAGGGFGAPYDAFSLRQVTSNDHHPSRPPPPAPRARPLPCRRGPTSHVAIPEKHEVSSTTDGAGWAGGWAVHPALRMRLFPSAVGRANACTCVNATWIYEPQSKALHPA